jgi:hypothetical protein
MIFTFLIWREENVFCNAFECLYTNNYNNKIIKNELNCKGPKKEPDPCHSFVVEKMS